MSISPEPMQSDIQDTWKPDLQSQDYDYPEEIKFLNLPMCKPDLKSNAEAKRLGNVRGDHRSNFTRIGMSNELGRKASFSSLTHAAAMSLKAAKHIQSELDATSKLNTEKQELRGHTFMTGVRRRIGNVILSWRAQAFVLLVVFGDLTLTFRAFVWGDELEAGRISLDLPCQIFVLVVFALDASFRIIYFGPILFFYSRINVFEFVLIILLALEILLVELNAMKDMPLGVLRVARPMFRVFRVARLLVRLLEKTRSFTRILRHKLSGSRQRFVEDDFDLDLAYVTPNLIAMSLPGVGEGALFHNPAQEIARFLNERHTNKYLVINVTEMHRYPTDMFFHRYLHFPIDQNSVPSMAGINRLCQVVGSFLDADPEHVVAVHSLHGQGRVSLVISALLLYLGEFSNVGNALSFVEQCRIDPHKADFTSLQSTDSKSQDRFLHYFSAQLVGKQAVEPFPHRPARIRKIVLSSMHEANNLDVSIFMHPGSKISPSPEVEDVLRGHSGSQEREADKNAAKVLMEPAHERHHSFASSRRALVDKVHSLLQECELDSRKAGATSLSEHAALVGTSMNAGPDSSFKKISLPVQANATLRDVQAHAREVAWECVDTEVTGLLRVEIHRSRRHDEAEGAPQHHRGFFAVCRALCSCRKRTQEKMTHGSHEGMLTAAWLHTSYLEFEGSDMDGKLLKHKHEEQHTMTIALDRYGVDKASGAPPLKWYSAAMKLEIDWQVDRRQGAQWHLNHRHELQTRAIDWRNAVTSHTEVSEEYELGWLNFALKHIWQYAAPGLGRLLHESIEPSLQDCLPAPLGQLYFESFEFSCIDENIPQLGPISACARDQEGFEVILDVWVNYSSPVKVLLRSAIAEFGISHITISGLLSVKLKPLVPRLPVIEGVQFFFLNEPRLDLTFSGAILSLANFDMLKRAIIAAIHSALADIILLPNIVVLNYSKTTLASGDSMAKFEDVLPCGVLRICVIGARDLSGSDHWSSDIYGAVCGRRHPDPYVMVRLGNKSQDTSVANGTFNPRWQEDLNFLLYDERQRLQLVVRHRGVATDKYFGEAKSVSVSEVVEAGKEGLWLPIFGDAKHHEGSLPRGKVHINATIFDFVHEEPNCEMEERMEVARKLPEASSVPNTSRLARMVHNSVSASKDLVSGHSSPRGTPPQSSSLGLATPSPSSMASKTDDAKKNGSPAHGSMSHKAHDGHDSLSLALHRPLVVSKSKPSVAVLIGRIYGGRIPVELAEPSKVELRLSCGGGPTDVKRCSEATHPNFENINDEVWSIIDRLTRSGENEMRIADLCNMELGTVQRILRKHGNWNLELLRRLCIILRPTDLEDSTHMVEIAVVQAPAHKGRVLGSCSVPLHRLLQADGMRIREEVRCTADGSGGNHESHHKPSFSSPGQVLHKVQNTLSDSGVLPVLHKDGVHNVELELELTLFSLSSRRHRKAGSASNGAATIAESSQSSRSSSSWFEGSAESEDAYVHAPKEVVFL